MTLSSYNVQFENNMLLFTEHGTNHKISFNNLIPGGEELEMTDCRSVLEFYSHIISPDIQSETRLDDSAMNQLTGFLKEYLIA